MTDPFDASKRDLEERDRVRMLVADARAILNKIDDDWWEWPLYHQIGWLQANGPFSWADARDTLAIIEFEDNNAKDQQS